MSGFSPSRGLLVVNPAARAVNRRSAAHVAQRLAEIHDVELVQTRHRGHATDVAGDAVNDGFEVVYALGGDGTVNEMVQALVGTDVCLGVLPGGGANVLVRALGLPNDIRRAASRLCDPGVVDRRISVGRANDRWFVCHAGFGFDAAVVRHVERRQRYKRMLGQSAYVWSALAEWAASRRRAPALVDVDVSGLEPGPAVTMSIVANTTPYTFLGARPLRLHPEASFDDGLDLLTVASASTRQLLRIVGRVLSDGSHVRLPGVDYLRDLDAFTLRAPVGLPLMADGEYLGRHTKVTFATGREALRVLA